MQNLLRKGNVVDFDPAKKVAKVVSHSYMSIETYRDKTDDSIQLVENYLSQLDWRVNENSNMSYSIQGLNNYIASEVSKNYWLNKVYTPEIKSAHVNGDIHIHDLNIISVYCVGWDLKDLLTYIQETNK